MFGWGRFKMSDENKINNDDKGSGKNGEFRVPPKTWIVWIVIIGGILALVLFKNQMAPPAGMIQPQEFLAAIDADRIETATVNPTPQSAIYEIVGKFKALEKGGEDKSFHVKMLLTDSMVDKLSRI